MNHFTTAYPPPCTLPNDFKTVENALLRIRRIAAQLCTQNIVEEKILGFVYSRNQGARIHKDSPSLLR